jgi:hypothetical protein
MEIILRILASTIAATSAMTLFSYVLSWAVKKCFKEPALLELVFESLLNIKNKIGKMLVAWIFHYSVGLFFILAYELIWSRTSLDVDWQSGLLFGLACGIIAIFAWSVLLQIPKETPKVNRKQYYIQLLIAHFIFSFTAIAVHQLMR